MPPERLTHPANAPSQQTELTPPSIKPWLARQAYSLLLRLATPAYLWRIWSRGKIEPLYRLHWPQRLGLYEAAYRRAWQQRRAEADGSGPVLWLHAVSLGEARAAAPLVQALRAQRPGMRLLLTHGTATGREAGAALLQAGDVQAWFPYDTPGAVRRFLQLHQPEVGVLMETEVWPNVQRVAADLGVPMVLANARLSDKSLRQGLRLAPLMRPAAQLLALALAQSDDDARRLRAMGAPQVRVCGNVKFDMSPPEALLARGQGWRQASARPIVLAASTREGEEPGLLRAWKALMASPAWPGEGGQTPRLWVVPRHPQRFDDVAKLVVAQGLTLSRRSQWPGEVPDAHALQADVWLGDTMGEMPAYYAAACVALLGGSFEPLGGQNLIEAAACACPVVMGPSTFNFEDAARLSEAAGAAFRVQDWAEGVNRTLDICHAQPLDAKMGTASLAALAFSRSHQGAARVMAVAIWEMRPPELGITF